MSRQNKLRKKRILRQRAIHEIIIDDNGKETLGKRKKGPRVPWGMPKGK